MPNQSFSLAPGGPKRLELSWTGSWAHMDVRLDGQQIGTFNSQAELRKGKSYRLADGSVMKIQLVPGLIAPELRVTVNGKRVQGASSEHSLRMRLAYGVMYLIGAVDLLIGLFSVLFQNEFIKGLGFGPYHVILGIIFLVLGYLVQRQTPYVLWIAAALFILDTIIGIISTSRSGLPLSIGGLVFRLLLVAAMLQAAPLMPGAQTQAE